MQTRIYLITFDDGCWIKAELPVDPAAALAQARHAFGNIETDGADVVSVKPVPDDDAAARKHARSIAAAGKAQNLCEQLSPAERSAVAMLLFGGKETPGFRIALREIAPLPDGLKLGDAARAYCAHMIATIDANMAKPE